jgi:Fe(3+) dicitrate transport protein
MTTNSFSISIFAACTIFFNTLFAQTEYNGTDDENTSTIIKVKPSAMDESLPTGELPPIYKNKIFSGKKASITNLKNKALPSEAHNTRHVLQSSSGVVVSDVNNQSFYSIAIRGIGDPHESQNVLLMVDDIPVSADFYGYPAAYYLPTMSSVESVEVTKSGAGLLYGSQPGGSLNFRLAQPEFETETTAKTQNVFGSNSLFTSFNKIAGGQKNFAYTFEAYRKQGAGQFTNNSAFLANGLETRLRFKLNEKNELRNQFSFYKGRFEEPGGLALNPSSGRIAISETRTQNTIANDELLVDRFEGRISHEYNSDHFLNITSTLWSHNMSRESHRQNGSGFGVVSTNNSNTIQDQDFFSFGGRLALAKDYTLGQDNSTFTANITFYKMNSPLEQGTGNSADADEYAILNRQIDRQTEAFAFSAENKFTLGSWSVTPSIRAETIAQTIKENFNGTAQLRDSSNRENIVLGGLAAVFTHDTGMQTYANLSEGFRPVQYSETVPTSSNTVVNEDLNSSKTLSGEIGLKNSTGIFEWDASVFATNYKNQIGTLTGSTNNTLGNVGEATYEGIDFSIKRQLNENMEGFANSQFLKARFRSGPLDEKIPAYAPHYLHKLGLNFQDTRFKYHLSATFSEEHYSDDNNNSERKIPSYSVWDIAGDFTPYPRQKGINSKVTFGINNISDNKYYTRVRANGIEPALERNFYAGFEVSY